MKEINSIFEKNGLLSGNLNVDRKYILISPHRFTIENFIISFAYSPERLQLISGFLEYRKYLRSLGVIRGFHWIGGSFVEAIEKIGNRPPGDIDVVTFAIQNINDGNRNSLRNLSSKIHSDRAKIKKYLFIDGYLGDLSPNFINYSEREFVYGFIFWYEMYSYSKNTETRKGFIEIPIETLDNDNNALCILTEIRNKFNWTLESRRLPL